MKWNSSTIRNPQRRPNEQEEVMNLLEPMRSQYSRSKHLWYRRAVPLGIGVYVAAIIAAFPWPSWVAGILAVGAVFAQITAFTLRHVAASCYFEAESIRRKVMLHEWIGLQPSPAQLARLEERSATIRTVEATLDRSYYDSEEPVGPRRLLDIIAQAAFFTSSLARRTWRQFALFAILGFAAPLILVLFASILHASESAVEVAARVVIASMAFWVAGEIAAMAVQFFQLALNTERLLDESERLLRQTDPGMTDALLVYTEYNCAVVKAPPIPFRVYAAARDKLNRAWEQRKIALNGQKK
jgi:prepilin signal peptidase PulO-like enzyme (type II secretory pathway)